MENKALENKEAEEHFCEYCCNFDKAHIGMDGMSICKITNMLAYCEANGSECPYFNTTAEKSEENLMRALNKCIDTENDNDCDNCPFDKFGADECIKKLLISARSHIAKLESKSRWISVEERLPIDEYNEFIKKYPDEEFECITMIKGAKIPTRLYFDGAADFYDYDADGNEEYFLVTYWMSLPEAPKEVSENV